ncbi:UDP-glucosyltransferase 2-like isoform X2 [Leptopilina boulardi]|uniref:UDP-glucosyltransferase 2-like isoform X2 n=1 Tax=Leptopilina boulardi TaxID=63433 RepID=UPI0021F60E4C|nr:UDP-glucosyltransferase 2-like isoform X2 [Leptopilina boulardi]
MISFRNFSLCLFLLICLISSNSDAYRILVIGPINSKSHSNIYESVAKALILKGHRVDVISHFELKNPPKNYTKVVNLDGSLKAMVNTWTLEIVESFRDIDLVPAMIEEFGNNLCDLMGLEKMQKFIKNPPRDPPYDLVIAEAFVANCYFGFGHLYKVPVVMLSALPQIVWFDDILGNPMSNAYTVHMETKDARIVTFWDRVTNHFWALYGNYRFYRSTEEYQTNAMRKYLSPDVPNVRELEKKTALLLVNAYQSFFGIRPLTPAVIPIAGIHVELSEAKLSPELKVWMDESTHGVVFFTLGSMVIIEDFPKEILLGLYGAFAKLAPIRVLMKIVNEEKLPPGLPKNVLTMSWIPQIPVLRHKNTKVFMTHGGLNSAQEGLYFAVPMIGFPLFGDQPLNIRLLADKNVAYEMDYRDITEKSVNNALRAVLYDPKYQEAAKRESQLFRDRPMNATDTAVFWIEYIIRNGANSLRSPSMDMPWWKAELVDVYLFFFISILLISYIIFLILMKISCLIRSILNPNSQNHRKKD